MAPIDNAALLFNARTRRPARRHPHSHLLWKTRPRKCGFNYTMIIVFNNGRLRKWMLYDLIALNGVSETQTQKQKISGQMYICSSGGWISLTGTGSSFTRHLLKHLQLIVHFLRDSRGGDSAARLPGWTVWSSELIQLFVLHHAGTNFLSLQRHKPIGLLWMWEAEGSSNHLSCSCTSSFIVYCYNIIFGCVQHFNLSLKDWWWQS